MQVSLIGNTCIIWKHRITARIIDARERKKERKKHRENRTCLLVPSHYWKLTSFYTRWNINYSISSTWWRCWRWRWWFWSYWWIYITLTCCSRWCRLSIRFWRTLTIERCLLIERLLSLLQIICYGSFTRFSCYS